MKKKMNKSFKALEDKFDVLHEIIKKQQDDANSKFSSLYETINQLNEKYKSSYVHNSEQIENLTRKLYYIEKYTD